MELFPVWPNSRWRSVAISNSSNVHICEAIHGGIHENIMCKCKAFTLDWSQSRIFLVIIIIVVVVVVLLTSCGLAYGRSPGPSTPAAISSGGTPCIM